jgi:hypothetical protein
MPTNFLELLEQAKTELIADIESGKINLKEYATGELDKYNEIADEYSNPEISKILQKWDNLGFDTEGEAVNAILQDKNWKNSFDVADEDASDIQKVSTWRSQITSKKKLGEARTFKVNPKYAYFAVGKSDNKIVTGWEIVDDVESLKYYAKRDLKDMDFNPSDYKLLSKNALIKQGIDPFNWNNWRKTEGSSTLNEDAPSTQELINIIAGIGSLGLGGLAIAKIQDYIKKKNPELYKKLEDTHATMDKAYRGGVDEASKRKKSYLNEDTPSTQELINIIAGIGSLGLGGLAIAKIQDYIKKKNPELYKKLEDTHATMDKAYRGGVDEVSKRKVSSLKEAGGEEIIQGDPKNPMIKSAAQDAIKRGDRVRIVKPGTTLQEKKKKEQPEEEEAPAEETEEQPENVEGEQSTSTPDTISVELEQQIKQAVDSAAEFIKSIDDKRYETALGKVIKNLTMAQAALAAVKERETKLAEEAGIERDKSMEKYITVFKKRLKKVIKDEALIQKIIKIYKSVIEKSHDKNVPAEKMTEQVWKHFTLHESVQKKAGVVLVELSNATMRSAIEKANDKKSNNRGTEKGFKGHQQMYKFSSELFKEFKGKKIKDMTIESIEVPPVDSKKILIFLSDENDHEGIITYEKGDNTVDISTTMGKYNGSDISQADKELITDIVRKFDPTTKLTAKSLGGRLSEMATGDQDLDNLTDFVRGPISNSKFRTIEKDIDIVRNGKNLVLTYTVDGKPQELPTDALGALQAKSIYTIEKTPDDKYKITVGPGEKKDIGRAFEKLKKNLSEQESTDNKALKKLTEVLLEQDILAKYPKLNENKVLKAGAMAFMSACLIGHSYGECSTTLNNAMKNPNDPKNAKILSGGEAQRTQGNQSMQTSQNGPVKETYEQAKARMSKVNTDSTTAGFGEGVSPDMGMARKMAMMNAKSEMGRKKTNSSSYKTQTNGTTVIEEKVYNIDNQVKYLIILDYAK